MMKEKPKKKKRNILLSLLVFLLTTALVLGTAALIIFRDQLNVDALKRWYHYRSLTLSDSGQAESFPYAGSPDDLFVDVSGDLLVCSKNAINLYSGSGTQYVSLQVTMSAPAASVCKDTAVVYDAGGTVLQVIHKREPSFSLEAEGNLLSAHLNADGLLTVVSQESGYRGVVTVYNSDGSVKASLRLSSAYVMDAMLADDGHSLWVITVGQESGAFASTLSRYDLNSVNTDQVNYEVTPIASVSLGNSVVLALEEQAGVIRVLGDYGTWTVDGTGALLGSVNWADRHLKNYTLKGAEFSAALLSQYRAGGQSALYLMDKNGNLADTFSLSEQVLSLDAAGQYLAVLTADRLDLYTADLTPYNSLVGTQGAQKVLLREDGTAMLISTDSARLYVPS